MREGDGERKIRVVGLGGLCPHPLGGNPVSIQT